MLARMREEIKSSQAEMRSALHEWFMDLKDGRNVTTTCNEATETEPDPRMMQYIEEHQEIPKEEASVIPVGEPRKRRRVCNLAMESHQKRKGRCPAMQKWNGEKGASSGMFRSKEILDRGRDLPSPPVRRPAMQQWHGAVKMSSEWTEPGFRQNEEPQNGEKTGKDCG
jgi:hypothetical protein